MNIPKYLLELDASKALSPYKIKMVWIHIKHRWDVYHVHSKNHSKKLERLQEQQILAPLAVDEMAEWCNRFVIVTKPNGTVQLCPDPAWLNQTLIRPIHRGPTWNDKVKNKWYRTIIDASSGYQNLKLNNKSSYLTTFLCQCGRYRFTRLSLGVVQASDMFQQ